MKQFILILLFIGTLALPSFIIPRQTDDVPGLGKAEQQQGIYIYYCSKPVKETVFVGKCDVGTIWKVDPEKMISKLCSEARKKYPTAEAIIVSPDMFKCDVVSFKK